MSGLITEEQLKEWTGEKTKTGLMRWLEDRGIAYYTGKNGRICCTLDSINNNLNHGVLSFEKAAG